MKSIMHDKKECTCYLCMKLHDDHSEKKLLEEHHVFPGANRKLSERYGLKVYLCREHHVYGKEAVHQNENIALMVKQDAQIAFKRKCNEDFRTIFGKNYLGGEEDG